MDKIKIGCISLTNLDKTKEIQFMLETDNTLDISNIFEKIKTVYQNFDDNGIIFIGILDLFGFIFEPSSKEEGLDILNTYQELIPTICYSIIKHNISEIIVNAEVYRDCLSLLIGDKICYINELNELEVLEELSDIDIGDD